MFKEGLDIKLRRILNDKHTDEEKESIRTIQKIDVEKNWVRFQNAINNRTKQSYTPWQRNRIYFARIAAAVLFLVLSATGIYIMIQQKDNKIHQVSATQENTPVILADGSKILLKKGSVISYPENLNIIKREVHFSGEGWFEISRSKTSPFYIYMKNTTIKVMGTSFNIKEDKNGIVTVNIVTGKVSFYENNNKNNVVMLEAGQQGVFDSNTKTMNQSTCNSENFLFWKTRILSFKNEPLDSVFKELENSYSIKIVVHNENILHNRLTTTFNDQELDDILKELSMLFDIHYYRQGDTVYLE